MYLPISLLVNDRAILLIGGGKGTTSVTQRSLVLQDSVDVLRDLFRRNSGVHIVIEPSYNENNKLKELRSMSDVYFNAF